MTLTVRLTQQEIESAVKAWLRAQGVTVAIGSGVSFTDWTDAYGVKHREASVEVSQQKEAPKMLSEGPYR